MTIAEQLANRDLSDEVLHPVTKYPSRARVVIVGGGIIGSSIAYHLTRAGETDVVMLERGRLTNGTTWHAAGLVSQVRGTRALTELTRHNAETYERLPGETGIETGLRRVGALTVARTEGRMQTSSTASAWRATRGIPVEVLPPAQVKDLSPGAVVDDLVGAVLFPTDGTVNPGDAALSFAKGAVDAGVRYVPETEVTDFVFDGGRVTGVESSRGSELEAETVVLACGLWTSELARRAGASVPLYPAEHVWVMTEEAEGADKRMPFLRDLDGYLYIRHYRRRCLRRRVRAEGPPEAGRRDHDRRVRGVGPDSGYDFAPVLANARQRVPELETIGFSAATCGRRRASRRTPTSSSVLPRRRRACSSRPASTRRASSSAPAPAARPPSELMAGHPAIDLTDFPEIVFGSGANSIRRIRLYEASVLRQCARIAAASSREGLKPAASVTNAFGTACRSEFRLGTTAASATAGCSISALSTSNGLSR